MFYKNYYSYRRSKNFGLHACHEFETGQRGCGKRGEASGQLQYKEEIQTSTKNF